MSLFCLDLAPSIFFKKVPSIPTEVMGLQFENPVGMAAGFDKDAKHINALAKFGFGFIEVGTVTPRAQSGNVKPRLFRIKEHEALINRMGFNNLGVDALVSSLDKSTYKGILGINIGKNKDTPIVNAAIDYVICMEKVYPHADYITVNISSPNTPDLRELQTENYLNSLLETLKNTQVKLKSQHQKHVPLVIKIAPDLSYDEIKMMALSFLKYEIDGVIATNTTLNKESIIDSPYGKEEGGLSGKPLLTQSNKILQTLSEILQGKIPIIASGGITDAKSAQCKLEQGASLIQLYTGLIYKGPSLVHEICSLIKENR